MDCRGGPIERLPERTVAPSVTFTRAVDAVLKPTLTLPPTSHREFAPDTFTVTSCAGLPAKTAPPSDTCDVPVAIT
ncbi:hypothetical protein D3C73_1357260 [compost metagenome]